MQKRFIFLFIAAILFALFVLYSCNESNVVENKKVVKQEKPVLKKVINNENETGIDLNNQSISKVAKGDTVKRKDIKGKEVSPKKPACDWKTVEVWEIEYYEPKPGKIVGVWPYYHSTSYLKNLRTKWGYSGIHTINHTVYGNAISAGFNKQNIMTDCSFPTGPSVYEDKINNSDAGHYYIGEAVNHKCLGNEGKRLYSPDELNDVAFYIHNHRYGSKFISDGYKRCGHFDVFAGIVDKIMFSTYKHWYKVN